MYDREMYLKAMGRRIKAYREARNMSMEELARMAGYEAESSRSTISKIEAGKRDLPASKVMAIAVALGCSPSDLLVIDIEEK